MKTVCLSPGHKSLSILLHFFLAQWVVWERAPSLHPSCVQIMSLCLWGSDSNGLVITVCLWVYRCIPPPPCLHGLWGWQIKITHLFSYPLSKEQLSSHREPPLWSYYKAQYFWSLPEWVQCVYLTWLGLGYTSFTFSLWFGARSCEISYIWKNSL